MSMTEEQVAALRYLIAKGRLSGYDEEICVLAKQLVWRLIEASQNLTVSVFTVLREGEGGFTAEQISQIGRCVSALRSANQPVHLDALLKLAGTPWRLNLHYGHVNPKGRVDTTGQFDAGEHPWRYTFWLSDKEGEALFRESERIEVTCNELEQIDLSKPGLYPTLER